MIQVLDHVLQMMVLDVFGSNPAAREEAALAAAGGGAIPGASVARLLTGSESYLMWTAETVLVATAMLRVLSYNGWSALRVARHPLLVGALDAVLEEETVLQVKAMSKHFTTPTHHSTVPPAAELSSSACPMPEGGDVCLTVLEAVLGLSCCGPQRLLGPRASLLAAIDRLLRGQPGAAALPSARDSAEGPTRAAAQMSTALRTLAAVFDCDGADALVEGPLEGILKSLVVLLRHPDASLRLDATGALAAAAQNVPDDRLPMLGAAEGLVFALVDVMREASDVLFRCVGTVAPA